MFENLTFSKYEFESGGYTVTMGCKDFGNHFYILYVSQFNVEMGSGPTEYRSYTSEAPF